MLDTSEHNSTGRYQDSTLLFLGLGILICVFALWGIPTVPFHPDESTYLFMSSDFEGYIQKPFALAWTPGQTMDPQSRYRLIDSPLPRYLLGAALKMGNLPSLPADWDWSKTWEENRRAGAMPSQEQLSYGRGLISLFLPLDLLLIFMIGRRLKGEFTGGVAMVLFGTHSLTLLHARRAMTEGLLVFGILLTLWVMLDKKTRPWLIGLCLGIAINSKLSAAGLIPAALLAAAYPPINNGLKNQRFSAVASIKRWVIFSAALITVTFLLNPFLWKQPAAALMDSVETRRSLLELHKTNYITPTSDGFQNSALERLANLLGHLYWAPPAFAETGNYLGALQQEISSYLQIPGHNFMRGLLFGSIWLILSIFGCYAAIRHLRSAKQNLRRSILICLLSNLGLAIVVMLLLELPWQRYVMPLVPFVCLWSGYGVETLIDALRMRKTSRLVSG